MSQFLSENKEWIGLCAIILVMAIASRIRRQGDDS